MNCKFFFKCKRIWKHERNNLLSHFSRPKKNSNSLDDIPCTINKGFTEHTVNKKKQSFYTVKNSWCYKNQQKCVVTTHL